MKVLLIGLPYFVRKLQKELSEYDKNNTYVFLNTQYNKLDKLKFLFHLINTDIIYIHGGLICCSELIDIALKLNKRIIMNWAGSDVLWAKKIQMNGNRNFDYINKIKHFAETIWIKNELKELGINVVSLLPITFCEIKEEVYTFPKKFVVLTYISQERPYFYGIDTILKLARDFPDIDFRIAGIDSFDKEIPKNIKFLGWVGNMKEEYKKCVVYIRMPKHDGLGATVIEALSYGRIVFRNYKFPYVNYFKDYDDLKKQLKKFIEDFNKGKLTINYEAINYVKKKFNKEKILSNIIKVFNEK
jgi:hypothetical protein